MKNNKMFSRLGAAMVVVLLLSSVQFSLAAGTLAGTTITNQASVQYNAGSNVRNGLSNEVTMTVGYKVSINLTASSSSTTTVDSTILYKAIQLTNDGNYADKFKYTINGATVPAGWVAQLYHDVNNSSTWDGSDVLLANVDSLSSPTAIAGVVNLILKITIPRGVQAGDDSTSNITVGVQSNGSGPAVSGIVRVGGVGTQTYTANVTINKPILSFSVVHTPSANVIPGENQSYALTVTNTGKAATVGNSTITWKYEDAKLENENAVSGSATTGDAVWTIGSLAAQTGTTTVTFTADIEQTSNDGTGVPAGTAITNGTTGSQVAYNDGLHGYSVNVGSTSSFNVAQASGAVVIKVTSDQNGNPGDSLTYLIKVANRGNSTMTFTLSQLQNGGNLDTTHLFTETSAVTGSQPFVTSTIPAGDTLDVYSYLIVNVTGIDEQTIIRNLTATPNVAGATPTGGSNYNPTVTVTTTLTSPSLNIDLQSAHVYGVGTVTNPAPGDSIEYTLTITNNGTGTATNLTTTNAIPANTTFGPDSYGSGLGIMVDGVAKTNSSNGDGATYNLGTVTAGPFSVAGGGATKIVKYRVAIN